MKCISTIAACVFLHLVLFCASTADAIVSLDFTDPIYGYTNGDIEANGMFTYSNVQGSGIDVTITRGGLADVNDFIDNGGLRIGQNTGESTGAMHTYTFSFSEPVVDVELDIVDINFGSSVGGADIVDINFAGILAVDWNDQLTFDPGVVFSGLTNGVSFSGTTVLPANRPFQGNNSSATASYASIDRNFTIVHGLGATDAPNPGVIGFLGLRFNQTASSTIPEPLTATLGLIGLGVLGMATRRRAA